MILLSLEQLTSQTFNHLLQTKTFSEHVVALALDEMHLVIDWMFIILVQWMESLGSHQKLLQKFKEWHQNFPISSHCWWLSLQEHLKHRRGLLLNLCLEV